MRAEAHVLLNQYMSFFFLQRDWLLLPFLVPLDLWNYRFPIGAFRSVLGTTCNLLAGLLDCFV